MADFFTWVGRAAHGGHAARTLSREGDAATVTRRRTDRPQWCQGAGMNGSDLEKNRDLLFVHTQKNLKIRLYRLRLYDTDVASSETEHISQLCVVIDPLAGLP